MTQVKRLLLLDGHSLAYRAFYALPVENFSTTGGQPTNAIYGFASMLANALRDEQPTHVAVTFDVSRQTFRTEAFPDYKAGRSRSPDEFNSQMGLLTRLLEAMRLPTLRLSGYEADDLIATLTTRAEAAGFEVLIITGDRDVLQLVSDRVTVLYFYRTASELIRYTPEKVAERYGLTPAQYPDFAALRGDPSDNLPSIPGIGEKTAAKWIREFGSFDALVERSGEVKGKAGDKLRDGLEAAKLNRRLTELVRDVDLPLGLDDLQRRPYDLQAFTSLLDDLEFRNASLRQRLFAADPGGGVEEAAAQEPAARLKGRELGPGEVAGWLGEKTGPGETAGLTAESTWVRGEGRVVRVAIANGEGFAASFEPSQMTEADEKAFAAWLADPEIPKALHDVKSLLRVFAEHGRRIEGIAADTAMAAYLLKPGLAAYGIADLSAQYLGRRPPAEGAAGLMLQARAVLELAGKFAADLDETGMAELLYKVELPLSELLARMERTGVYVDRPLLVELEEYFTAAIERATDEAARIAGRPFNPGSTKQLQEVLFGDLGLPKTKKIKSGHSTDVDALTWLATQTANGMPEVLLHHRDQSRLRMTVAGLIKEIGADRRIHTSFQQTVAATGRITSTEPNLQVIPIKTAEGRRIRQAFLPGAGFESIMTADYRQLELRIMAHLSGDPGLLAAFESGEDLHTTMAAQVFAVPPDAVTAEMRRKIKAMSYGLAYGLSAFGLSRQLGIAVSEARPLMDAYFERFGGVRDFLHQAVEEARKTSYTQTILGRRRYLPHLTSPNKQRRDTAERMALNAPIQGSAADLVKMAMLRVTGALAEAGLTSRLLLQVHDEFVLEVAPGERDRVAELVHAGMTTAYPINVGLEVAIGTGVNWDAAAH